MPLLGLLLFFLFLLLTTTACIGGGDEPAPEAAAPEAAVQATGTLVCSADCINQGQCGTTLDGRIVILGHSGQPATRDHNTTLLTDSVVFLREEQQRTVMDPAGNTSVLNFFAVQPTDGGPMSWVAGTCVNRTVQQ